MEQVEAVEVEPVVVETVEVEPVGVESVEVEPVGVETVEVEHVLGSVGEESGLVEPGEMELRKLTDMSFPSENTREAGCGNQYATNNIIIKLLVDLG